MPGPLKNARHPETSGTNKRKIVYRKVSALVPFARNSRTHSDEQIAQIAASIREFGWTNPLLIDEAAGLVAGHGRLLAARQLGLETVPCIVLDGLSEAQKRALVIADNQLALTASWDEDLLSSELAGLIEAGFDLSLLGFHDDELASLLADRTEGLTDPDDAPETPEDPVTRLGDVWLLGKHRIVCGDSTDAGCVERLMGGKSVEMLWTDPPYGVAYQTKLSTEEAVARHRRTDGLEVTNDALTPGQTQSLVADVLRLAPLRPGGVFYVASPSGDMELRFRLALEDAGLPLREAICWVKDRFVMGRQDYHWRHESILYGWREGGPHYFVDDRTQDTVWEIPRPGRSNEHPTMKPVELVVRAIKNSSRDGDAIYEPFAGSGTTIISAEMTGRACYALEIAPHYVDVAVIRWQEFTGQQAVHEDGRLFDDLHSDAKVAEAA